jgi:hypothetical protein
MERCVDGGKQRHQTGEGVLMDKYTISGIGLFIVFLVGLIVYMRSRKKK